MCGLRPPNFLFDLGLVDGVTRALLDLDTGVEGTGVLGYLKAYTDWRMLIIRVTTPASSERTLSLLLF